MWSLKVFMGYCCVLACRDFPHNLIASILVSLTFKDTRAGLKFLLDAEGIKRLEEEKKEEILVFFIL